MTDKEFLYKYDNGIKFTEPEIISMCKGEIGNDVEISYDDGDIDDVICDFKVANRHFSISYIGANETTGQAFDDDFSGSYPTEIQRDE